jgi:excisionase family DNA binding protein
MTSGGNVAESTPSLRDVQWAVRFLDISERGLRRLVAAGAIPTYRVGRQLRFDEAELREVLRAGRGSA